MTDDKLPTHIMPETQAQINGHLESFAGRTAFRMVWSQPQIEALRGRELLLTRFGVYWRPVEDSEFKPEGFFALAVENPNEVLAAPENLFEYGGEELAQAFLQQVALYNKEPRRAPGPISTEEKTRFL